MPGPYAPDAGGFSSWLREVRRALIEGDALDVPCGNCDGCCASSWSVLIGPEDDEAIARIPREFVLPAPGRPQGYLLMGCDADGNCPMNSNGRCSIYEHRPRTCRFFDCRVFPAAEMDAGCAEEAKITERIWSWEFSYPAARDREEHAAVQAAGRFLLSRFKCFPPGFMPGSTTAVASLAVKVYDVFLECAWDPEEPACGLSDAEIVDAVVAAHGKFEASVKRR